LRKHFQDDHGTGRQLKYLMCHNSGMMHQTIAEENMGMGMSTLKICEEIVNVDELENMLLLGGLI